MQRLLAYLGKYKLYSVLAPLFKCLEACFELFVPLVVADMIDIGIREGSISYILGRGGLLIALGLIGLACSITAQWFAARVAVKTGTAIRNDLFSHILGMSYSELDTIGSSTLLTRLTSDINQVQNGVNMFLRLFMRSPFIVFGAMIMAFSVDIKGGMIFAVAVPLLMVVVFCILLLSMPLYEKVQKQLDSLMLTTRENLLGVRVIRAFNRQESEKADFKEENTVLVKLQIFVGRISALLNPLTVVIINIAIVALLYTGALEVNAGDLTQGKLVALVNYMSQILVELIKLANLIILISKAIACMRRVDAVMSTESEADVLKVISDGNADSAHTGSNAASENGAPENPDTFSLPVLEFKDVSFAYKGAKAESLKDISFSVKRGETVGIIGATGAGKTTLINLIPRFFDSTEGSINIFGKDIKAHKLMELRKRIGIVPQKSVLFSGSLRDNMKWGRKDATDEEIYEAIDTAQAREIVDSKKEGLDLKIEQGGSNLSGGQKQRFAIARALVRKPEILIMDDSASALDFATDAALRRAIKKNTSEMTVFIISQRVGTVRDADRILVLEEGRSVGFGTHRELIKSCNAYREICLSQMTAEEVARDEA